MHFVPTLCDTINLAFENGIFPKLLKISYTIPIFKKGDPNSITNYRPISILPFLSKIIERCMHIEVINYLCVDNKFGFIKKISAEDAILKIVAYLYDVLNYKWNRAGFFFSRHTLFSLGNERYRNN